MSRKYINTLVAIAVLAAMWGVFTYLDHRKHGEIKTEAPPSEKLVPVQNNNVQSLTFKPRGGEEFTAKREGGKWVIDGQKKLAADDSAVSSLLTSLTSATVVDVVDPHPSSLKDFGLDPPAFSLDVATDAKPSKVTLLLGDDTPTNNGLYAQVAGNPRVFTLGSYLKSNLEKNLFDLRDRRAFTLSSDQIQKIQAESKGKKLILEKNPEGVWDLVLPPAVRADRFAAENLVSQLGSLTMQSVVSEDTQKAGAYGFGTPEVRVEVSGSGVSQTLIVGKKGEKQDASRYYAMNSALSPVFTVGSDFLTQVQKDPSELRAKDLFSFSSFEASKIEADTPKGHRVFEKKKEKQKEQWKQTAPSAKDEPSEKVEMLLNRLRDLRADSFPKEASLAPLGLAKPAYQFNVQFGDKNKVEKVEAARSGDHVYARLSTDSLASELSKTALDDIEKALNDL
jgi:hypothetical protein